MKKEISLMLKLINDNFHSKVDAHVRSENMTASQSRVLHFIRFSGGVTTQKQIEDFLEVSHPTVVGLLSRMQKSGYIECGYDDTHGKNKIVRETAKAVAFDESMRAFFDSANAELLEGLTQDEKDELMRLLEILYENVKK